MAASIIMNQMIVGGAGGSIRLLHGASLPEKITPRAIFVITEESVSGRVIQADEPEHAQGLIWIEVASVTEQVIGSDGEEAVELVKAWLSIGTDWVPLDAYHSAAGAWAQFSAAVLPIPIPQFSYTGNSKIIEDGRNWKIKFLTSGTLTLAEERNVDVFLVGGGGGGGTTGITGGAGGGGYTTTQKGIKAKQGVAYQITIGAGGKNGSPGVAGGSTSAFGFTAAGGKGAVTGGYGGAGGSGGGGSGGIGGSDGTNGEPSSMGGTGQGRTTREFEEGNGDLYAGGGSGGSASGAAPGGGGGARQGGIVNTGGGSGGLVPDGTYGGSGIAIIRNAR